ncbi:MAG: ATP-binding protein [Bacteroidales bacterium]|nr:ATP-binding protein [Bacteroidales bacterium]MBQ9312061.1 ATP-binding protein [Bacteroidales bacterium]
MIERKIFKSLQEKMFSGKTIILIGARQVGKTTVLKEILAKNDSVLWFEGDNTEVRNLFNEVSKEKMASLFGKSNVVIIDEAQRIQDIGLKAKIIHDQIPNIQLILTGSSSFELSNNVNEPLTGRKWEFKMYPLSFEEMVNHTNVFEEIKHLSQRLIYGMYPEVVTHQESAYEILNMLADSYLYKDVLEWERIKKPDKLLKLLQALAYQIGSEVSTNELSRLVGLERGTVENYISILEKAQIIFRLSSFSRNLRTELKNSKKIYFYDTGIRNSLINNFSQLDMRNDTGALWENFMISEKIKYNAYNKNRCNTYFWRTTQQQEIDFLEEKDGQLFAYEFKWNKNKKAKISKTFTNNYENVVFKCITPENYYEILQ